MKQFYYLSYYLRVLLFLTIVLISSISTADQVKDIIVEGNQRIEQETVISNLGIKVGDEFSLEIKSDLLKRLYATGLFKNIIVSFSSGKLTVTVHEAPFVSKISFIGNAKLSSQAIMKEIVLKDGDVITDTKLQLDITKIQELYKHHGYFLAIVRPKIETVKNNRVNLTFEIIEGVKTYVKKIIFINNGNYTDSELKSVILTKERAWFRFLDPNTIYDPDRVNYDKELLKHFYQSLGFADCNVLSATAELSPAKDYFILTYVIDEGNKYNIGDINVKSDIEGIDPTIFDRHIKNESGTLFNISRIETISEKISAGLTLNGFYQVEVDPIFRKHDDKNLVDVTFNIERARKAYIRNINITGNVKTDDHVIRREIPIVEGDMLDRLALNQAEQNLKNLNFFEKVNLRPVTTESFDKYDLLVEVEDKSTSSIGASVGYNTEDGIFGNLSFKEINLIGTGKELETGIYRTAQSTSYYINLEDPHFLNKDISAGINLFRYTKNRDKKSDGVFHVKTGEHYSYKSDGAGLSFGYLISENLRHNIDYSIKFDKISIPERERLSMIQEDVGSNTYSILGNSLTYVNLDSKIVPKNGCIVSAAQEFSGLGGNVKYLKHEFRAKFYKSFMSNKLTLKLTGNFGDIRGLSGQHVIVNDRFKLGGETLRGFAANGIGPREKDYDNALGGKRYYTASTELIFPLGLPKELDISGSIFTDIGGLWGVDLPKNSRFTAKDYYNDKRMRMSVGIGITWVTKFAPIRFDYAIPIKKQKYDDTQRALFRMSTSL